MSGWTREKKILFIVSGLLNTGGIEKYNQNLVRAAIESDYSISIVSRNDTQKRFNDIPLSSYGHIKNSMLKKAAFSLMAFWKAFSFNPDIIICGHVNFSPLCYMLSKFSGKKYIVLTYGIDVWDINSSARIKALKEARLIISISHFTKDMLAGQVREVRNKIQLLPPTIDGSFFYTKPKPNYLMKKHSLRENDKIILTVARLKKTEGYKGYYKVLDALPDILKEIPETKYILVGSGDDLRNIQRHIRERNLEDMVILTGFIPDEELPDYYNLCDVFVMPSKKEGFGIVFLEALACGKPVIAGNKDGSRDAILNGELGILVDPDNPEDIKLATVKALKGSVGRRLLDGKYLRERVIEEYGVEKFRERMEAIIGRNI